MITARILADSVGAVRLTTFELVYPRYIHAAVMTYRMWSRNGASSRAIPVEAMLRKVVDDPAAPAAWGANQPGMVAGAALTDDVARIARATWLEARDAAVCAAGKLAALGVHKQHVNRLLEPFQWMTLIVTATDWDNCFEQRIHDAAQPEFQALAEGMRTALDTHTPTPVNVGGWHLPLVREQDWNELTEEELRQVSVARCARASYLTHHGTRDVQKDLALYERLRNASPPHWSPFEHVAQAKRDERRRANLRGWQSLRQQLEGVNE